MTTEKSLPPATYTAYLEGSLKLSKYGVWWHNGKPFSNHKVSDLFFRSLVWDPKDSCYYVRIGPQRARFTVEDTAYFVTQIDTDQSPWHIHLSDGTNEVFDPQKMALGSEDQFYFMVKGQHRARALRSVHQTLLQYAVSDRELMVHGNRITLVREIQC